jgi:hypothetical protein
MRLLATIDQLTSSQQVSQSPIDPQDLYVLLFADLQSCARSLSARSFKYSSWWGWGKSIDMERKYLFGESSQHWSFCVKQGI